MSRPQNAGNERRLVIAILTGLLCLGISFGIAGARHYRLEWRALQRQYVSSTKDRALFREGIAQLSTCQNNIERCPTCHVNSLSKTDDARIPLPFRPHGSGIGNHDATQIGCTACHGGRGRALDRDIAHSFAGSGTPDPLMKAPHIQAGCARCHLPGEKRGQERLLRGARLFSGLGCPVCHPLTPQGQGGWDFGPELKAMGRKSIDYIEASLINPTANFEGSTMPSFKYALEKEPDALVDLTIFIESLTLPRLDRCRNKGTSNKLVSSPCSMCHGGVGRKASGGMRHRCPYILEKTAELTCANCHQDIVPNADGDENRCPLILQHRSACPTCHEGRGTAGDSI